MPLYSTDGKFFLMVQSTGELGVFNTAQYATYGPSPLATAWRSQSFSLNAPFYLAMQDVRPCSLYSLGFEGSVGGFLGFQEKPGLCPSWLLHGLRAPAPPPLLGQARLQPGCSAAPQPRRVAAHACHLHAASPKTHKKMIPFPLIHVEIVKNS